MQTVIGIDLTKSSIKPRLLRELISLQGIPNGIQQRTLKVFVEQLPNE